MTMRVYAVENLTRCFVVQLHWENPTVTLVVPIDNVSAADVNKSSQQIGVLSKFQPARMTLTFQFFCPKMFLSVTRMRENTSLRFAFSTTFHAGVMSPNWTDRQTDGHHRYFIWAHIEDGCIITRTTIYHTWCVHSELLL